MSKNYLSVIDELKIEINKKINKIEKTELLKLILKLITDLENYDISIIKDYKLSKKPILEPVSKKIKKPLEKSLKDLNMMPIKAKGLSLLSYNFKKYELIKSEFNYLIISTGYTGRLPDNANEILKKETSDITLLVSRDSIWSKANKQFRLFGEIDKKEKENIINFFENVKKDKKLDKNLSGIVLLRINKKIDFKSATQIYLDVFGKNSKNEYCNCFYGRGTWVDQDDDKDYEPDYILRDKDYVFKVLVDDNLGKIACVYLDCESG